MAKIGELDLFGVKILNRDFAGEKFGPDARQFSVEITDPQMQDQLRTDGVKLWIPNYTVDDEPPRAYLNVRIDFRYNDVDILMITPEGNGTQLDERTVATLDKAWIKNADMHIVLNAYNRPGRSGVTAYCKTLVVTLMSTSEREALLEERGVPSNPVMDRYKSYFGG